jgi:hypothetical protein
VSGQFGGYLNGNVLDKVRHFVSHEGNNWHVDVYEGLLDGVVLGRFNAETNRMKAQIEALSKLVLTPQQRAQMEHGLTQQNREHVCGTEANRRAVEQESSGPTGGNGTGQWAWAEFGGLARVPI